MRAVTINCEFSLPRLIELEVSISFALYTFQVWQKQISIGLVQWWKTPQNYACMHKLAAARRVYRSYPHLQAFPASGFIYNQIYSIHNTVHLQ